MGCPAEKNGRKQAEKEHCPGGFHEVPEPISSDRNAVLPVLWEDAPAEDGIQKEGGVALRHLY